MNSYLIGFPAEIQAQQLLEPYGYAHIVVPRPPGQSWDDYAWNEGNGMKGGTKIILSYTDGTDSYGNPIRVPIVETTWFWCNVISPEPDEALFNRFSGQPIIEIFEDGIGRAYHLAFDINSIKGISPVWAGMPDLGWPYDDQEVAR